MLLNKSNWNWRNRFDIACSRDIKLWHSYSVAVVVLNYSPFLWEQFYFEQTSDFEVLC